MRIFLRLSLFAALCTVARAAPAAGDQAAPLSPPAADHHTHIWSLGASQLTTDPILPAVELPEDLAEVLRQRQELVKSKDPAVMSQLYTDGAMVLDAMAPIWLKGDDGVRFVAQSMGSLPMTPMAFDVTGDSGYIAGTYTVGEGEQRQHLSNFLLVLRKSEEGRWRIAVETFTPTGPPVAREVSADQLVKELDAAGVPKAAVLSVAYWFGGPGAVENPEEELAGVRRENDWVIEQAGRHPDRLLAFVSVNPLKDYAVAELERCAAERGAKGLKLHLGNSRVDVRNPEHARKLHAVFEAANGHRLPIVIHLWTLDKDYGAGHSQALLEEVFPAAPDIPIQIAHMAASGPNYHSDEAFEVFAEAAARGDPRMKNVYTDVASMVTADTSDQTLELVAHRLRQFGLERVLFGSDRAPGGSNATPAAAWAAFQRLPLTQDEFRTVARNEAPYMRGN